MKKPYDDFEKRVIELMNNIESLNEEHYPYRFIRQLVKTRCGKSFYIYQGGLYDEPDKKSLSNHTVKYSIVEDLKGNTLGNVRPSIYWDKVREFKEKETNKSFNEFMKG